MTAYHLRKKGWSVTIVEKDRFGHGASHGNCGLVVPNHVVPLNTPANLFKGIGWMFKNDAPLFIRHRFDAAWIRWIIQFVRHCLGNHRQRSVAGRAPLMAYAIALYDDLIKTEGIDCDWDISGACHLFRDKKACDAYAKGYHLEKAGESDLQPVGKKHLRELMPALASGVTGGWYDPRVAAFRPDAFMGALARILKKMGVAIHEQTEWRGFGQKGNIALIAHTSRGVFVANAFVVATGAWTPLLAPALGCRLPIQPGKGYSVTTRRPDSTPALPCFFEEQRVVMTPWSKGMRLGGTLEFTGHDDQLNPRRLASLYNALGQYMPLSVSNDIKEEWCGWRPMTWDGLPIIDRLPDYRNVILAAGHNELGITMAPATGRLVAEMVNQEIPSIGPAFYRIGRFLQ